MKNNTDLLATWKLLLSLELIWREYVSKGIDLVRMNHGDFHQIPYSGKFLLEANFRDFCRQTCFRENKNRKKYTKMEIDEVITCVR